jgi:hypothetical protein
MRILGTCSDICTLLAAGNRTFVFVLVRTSVLCYLPARVFKPAVQTGDILCMQSAPKFVRQDTWMARDKSDLFNAFLVLET